MAKRPSTRKATLAIRADQDGDRRYVVYPDNNDAFVRTGRQMIEACRLSISVEVWIDELNAMLRFVHDWVRQRAQSVRACFASAEGARVTLFFCPAQRSYDFVLADQLTDLNSALVKDFNVGMVEVRQVPWAEIDRFLDLDLTRLVYGDKPTAHPAMDA